MVGETLQVLANGKQIETAGLRQFVTHPMPAAKVATALTDQLPELASEWLKMVGGLRPAQQIEEVIAELRRRNPRFDGVSRHKIDSGAVTEFRIQTDDISDISPVRALDKLKVFDCLGNYPRHGLLKDLKPLKGLLLKELNVNCTQVDDLSPLVGMPLTHLHVFYTRISDLSPLQGMPLTFLNCASTDIKDLSAVQNFPLTILSCGDTQIDDLSPLSSMKLISLNCISTRVSSFAPLKDMKLAELYFTDVPVSDLSHLIGMPLQAVKFKVKSERDGQIMRAIDTIHTINDRPASEFWKTWDAQQPSKESQRS
jgi:Leucine-rich repeat (LRR) protein